MADVLNTPEPLPQTTTERLLKVADIVEAADAWEQSEWMWTPSDSDERRELNAHLQASAPEESFFPAWDSRYVKFHQGRDDSTCGTTGCIAGWAVRYTPTDIDLPGTWESAGRVALGLDRDLASPMFSSTFCSWVDTEDRAATVAHVLRVLAEIPEAERTLDTVRGLAEDDEKVRLAFQRYLED